MLLTTATCILGVVLVAQAAPLSVSGLLADPDRFNGRPVTVSGRMSNLRESVSRRGTRRYIGKPTPSRATKKSTCGARRTERLRRPKASA
jgi:hypothetical protein